MPRRRIGGATPLVRIRDFPYLSLSTGDGAAWLVTPCGDRFWSLGVNAVDGGYPYRELFTLMKQSGYDRWTLCEAAESQEPERVLRYYRALWLELNRA